MSIVCTSEGGPKDGYGHYKACSNHQCYHNEAVSQSAEHHRINPSNAHTIPVYTSQLSVWWEIYVDEVEGWFSRRIESSFKDNLCPTSADPSGDVRFCASAHHGIIGSGIGVNTMSRHLNRWPIGDVVHRLLRSDNMVAPAMIR